MIALCIHDSHVLWILIELILSGVVTNTEPRKKLFSLGEGKSREKTKRVGAPKKREAGKEGCRIPGSTRNEAGMTYFN